MCPCALRSQQERPSHLPNPKCPTLYKETVAGRKSRASDPEPADDGDGDGDGGGQAEGRRKQFSTKRRWGPGTGKGCRRALVLTHVTQAKVHIELKGLHYFGHTLTHHTHPKGSGRQTETETDRRTEAAGWRHRPGEMPSA